MFKQRNLLIFVLKVFLLILLFAAAWPFIAPAYSKLLAGAANLIAPLTLRVGLDGSQFLIYSGAQLKPLVVHILPFQAGLILLVVLLLATPGVPLKQRLVFICLALVVTFLVHLSSLFVMTTREKMLRSLVVFFASVGIYLFPVLIWLVFTGFYYWNRQKATLRPKGNLSPG